MNILVTGSSGFIGRHVVKALREAGHEVFKLDKTDGGNLLNSSRLPTCDAVIHLAALCNVAESISMPWLYWHNNVAGTINLLERCETKHLIFASSLQAKNPENPYGRTKLCCEMLLEDCANRQGMQLTILRLCNVVGPGEDKRRIISRAFDAALRGEAMAINGDGQQERDFIDARDVASAFVLAVALSHTPIFRVLDIGSGELYSVLEIVHKCEQISGVEISRITAPEIDEPFVTKADTTCAADELNWKAKIPLDQSMHDIWADMLPDRLEYSGEFPAPGEQD